MAKPYDVEQLRAIGNSAVAQAAGIAHVPTHQLLALLDDLTRYKAALECIANLACDGTDPVSAAMNCARRALDLPELGERIQ